MDLHTDQMQVKLLMFSKFPSDLNYLTNYYIRFLFYIYYAYISAYISATLNI